MFHFGGRTDGADCLFSLDFVPFFDFSISFIFPMPMRLKIAKVFFGSNAFGTEKERGGGT